MTKSRKNKLYIKLNNFNVLSDFDTFNFFLDYCLYNNYCFSFQTDDEILKIVSYEMTQYFYQMTKIN